MIITYQEFLNESNFQDGITEEELELLNQYEIYNYTFNPETRLIDIEGTIAIYDTELTELPKLRLGKITGSFVCRNNRLTTLKYCPEWVGSDFACNNNNLTSLEYGPKYVGEYFWCNNNKLTSLEHCPEYVGYSFCCKENKITSLKGCPEEIKGEFTCYNNLLNSLEYGPKIVGWNYDCSSNRLTSLEYCPEIINATFNCSGNLLESLDHSPLIVKHNFYCSKNRIVSIEDYPYQTTIERDISPCIHFPLVLAVIKKNPEKYEILKNDKVKFHQQIMRDDPELISFYPYIQPPSKKSIL